MEKVCFLYSLLKLTLRPKGLVQFVRHSFQTWGYNFYWNQTLGSFFSHFGIYGKYIFNKMIHLKKRGLVPFSDMEFWGEIEPGKLFLIDLQHMYDHVDLVFL